MSKQIEHKITIEMREPDEPAKYVSLTGYRPVCSCNRYRGAWGWTRAGAESRGRAHVERAKAADARRAGIISSAAGRPLTGRHRAGGRP